MKTSPVSETPTAGGCGLAVFIGLLTIVIVSGCFSLVTGRPLNLREEWGVFLFQALIVAIPFGLLALSGVRDRIPWLVGLALTTAFWGYYLFDGIRYQLGGDKSGVNFGLAFLMLASPAVISAACLVAAKARHRSS
jgi:hypothetical protein